MSVVATKPITPADLLAMPDGKNYELLGGELVERNVSVLSSNVEARLFAKLSPFVYGRQLGELFTSTNGIQCFPDPHKVRRPDISFVKRERFSPELWKEGFLSIAPDLAVEVISPNDLAEELNERIEDFKSANIALIWVIDPKTRTVLVFRHNGSVDQHHHNDELSGEDILPKFQCRVGELFPEIGK